MLGAAMCRMQVEGLMVTGGKVGCLLVVGSSGNDELQEAGLGALVLEARSRRRRRQSHGARGPAPLRQEGAGVHGAVMVDGGEDAGSRQRRPAGQEQSSNRGGVHGEERWPRQGQELAGTPSAEDGARGSAPLCVWRRG